MTNFAIHVAYFATNATIFAKILAKIWYEIWKKIAIFVTVVANFATFI